MSRITSNLNLMSPRYSKKHREVKPKNVFKQKQTKDKLVIYIYYLYTSIKAILGLNFCLC